MDASGLIRAGLAFAVAGSWISLASLASERLGSRLGGLVANLPSNIVVSLTFIGISRGTDFAADAALAVPLGMAIDTVFLLALVLALPRGASFAVPVALGAWLACAALAALLPPLGPGPSIALFAALALASFLLLDRVFKIRAVARAKAPFRLSTMLIRALFAGTVVSGAVIASTFAPPYLTGIVATFPAVLLSTMVILSLAQGAEFARATGKILMLANGNIVAFALVAAYALPRFGIFGGIGLAFLAAIAWVAAFLPLSRKIA